MLVVNFLVIAVVDTVVDINKLVVVVSMISSITLSISRNSFNSLCSSSTTEDCSVETFSVVSNGSRVVEIES